MNARLKAGGVSADAVRKFLLQAAELESWTAEQAGKILGVDGGAARDVIAALTMVGYIEPEPGKKQRWRNTAAGNTVAGFKAVRPITRKTADRALADLLARVQQVNTIAEYLYSVDRVILFGPYLTRPERVKDVDVAIGLAPKERDPEELERLVREDAKRAETAGKRFKSFADRREWGRNKVRQFLKSRSRAIALNDIAQFVLEQPHEVLFELQAEKDRTRVRHPHGARKHKTSR
jgi:hypothetical protein